MAQGIIKTKIDKGIGIIETEGSPFIFFHNSACNGEFESLAVGQTVSFELGQGGKWPKAENVMAESYQRLLQQSERTSTTTYAREDLELLKNESQVHLAIVSPTYDWIKKIQSGELDIYNVHWRQFETIIAELLDSDDWDVELQRGTKDNVVDILARKFVPYAGWFLTIWQAKRLGQGNNVDIKTIRELADTCSEFKASKGIIVTSSYLTADALERVVRDSFVLGKIDHDDLAKWIQGYKKDSSDCNSRCWTRAGKVLMS